MRTALLLLAAFVLSGCGPAVRRPARAVSPGGGFPVTVRDSLGQRVTLARPPGRIISLAPNLTEILFALGAGGRVVGVTGYCNYPPEALRLPKIGGMIDPSPEKILALQPDLVLGGRGNPPRVLQALRQAGITVVAIDPEQNIPAVLDAIELVGRLAGREPAARRLVAEMRRRIAAVEARVRPIPIAGRPLTILQYGDNPIQAAGAGTFGDQVIRAAGGRNLVGDFKGYPQLSPELVIIRDPEVILVTSRQRGQAISSRPGFSRVRAVRERRIYLLNEDIVSRPGPRIVDAVEQVYRLLHGARAPG